MDRMVSISEEMGWGPNADYLDILRELLAPAIADIKRFHGPTKQDGQDDPGHENQFGISDIEEQALMLMRIMRYMRLPERIETGYVAIMVEEAFGISPERIDDLFYLMQSEEELKDEQRLPIMFNTLIDARLSNWSPARMQTTPYGEED